MKQFDQAYFDKWYRDPKHKVGTRSDLERQVHLAVSAAEYMLARPIRTVLDVGAGEGRWQPLVQRLRPSAQYIGIDPSAYTVRRYGRRRTLLQGTCDDLDTHFDNQQFDLVVCCSVLNYLPRAEMRRALRQLARRTRGVAFLEIFSREDDVYGDTNRWHTEPAATYRKMVRAAGFTPCGMHCYITDAIGVSVAALETT